MEDKFPNVSQDWIDINLSEEVLQRIKYKKNVDVWCKYCANRELCTAYYCNTIK